VTFTPDELRRALERDELFLLYQAQVDLGTGRFAGIECAIRWRHPTRGLLHAVPFVYDVPSAGLAPDFMRYLLRTSTRQIAEWRSRSIAVPRFAVNAWPESIGPELLADAVRACESAGIERSALEIETPPEAVYDAEMCARLRAFRTAGVRVALDDFGDGDVRFAALRDAPFDVVKIPVTFVRGAGRPYDDAVMSGTIAFAKAIGAETVAEGIETIAVRDRVRELGCDIGQGYLWSRQVEAEEFPAVVRAIGVDGAVGPRGPLA
jgi:EAL domain-containing protein (putative c-di-GMP-specific phosphodiesterase class I)